MEPDYTDTHHCRLEVTEEPNTPDILKKLHTSPPRKLSVYVFLRTWKQKLPKNKTKKKYYTLSYPDDVAAAARS